MKRIVLAFMILILIILYLAWPVRSEETQAPIQSDQWFLVFVVQNGVSNGTVLRYHVMESKDICLECVKNAKLEVAKGGDAEVCLAIYCATGQALDEETIESIKEKRELAK